MSLQAIVGELLAATGASRCTLRQDRLGETFPVTHEALAPGVPSINVTPVLLDGALAAIVSLHQLAEPRVWSEREIELCTEAAVRVREVL